MLSDIEIAQAAQLKPIVDVASKLGIGAEDLIPYGHHIAKLSANCLNKLNNNSNGKLILVTAISPTPAGEGKTTTTIGLADALNHVGKKAVACLREPSLGPVFGMKGGATGGGMSQVVPMENINLHFTGDFHAITAANNLLAALIDNHIYHGNALQIDAHRISWKPCLDMNDRALRHITLHHQYGDKTSGFDITVASEVMAIFCLAENLEDLKTRLGEIQVATGMAGEPILARQLEAQGAMTALLKDAFQPNLVQTLEHTPALIHGGPFANIAHGCNSVIATKTALKLADYVVTEAGFGADLGAEKFIDIKCRKAKLQPDAVVIVATIRALKYHGGVDLKTLNEENIELLLNGISNLKRHLNNLHEQFGLAAIVAINQFYNDTQAEIDALKSAVEALGFRAIICKHWAQGGAGATELAHEVIALISKKSSKFKFLYQDSDSLTEKLTIIAKKMYGAVDVKLSHKAEAKLIELSKSYNHLPICIAKTQYSFSTDPGLRGAPTGHSLEVSDIKLSRGAGFVVAICGDIMTMPGLPKMPASARIDVSSAGSITGLS
jgi:formate--tetrahydrofolate ligase